MTYELGGYTSEPREIGQGVWWLPQCLVMRLSGELTHLHASQFLILGSEKSLLFDTGFSQQWPSLCQILDQLLGDRPLDYVVPSHPEVLHSSNAPGLLERYPGSVLTGDIRDYPYYWPDYAARMVPRSVGDTLDLGGHEFTFLEALIKDLPSSQWGYEASQQILFVADGFAYSHQAPIEGDDHPTHAPGECTMYATELPGAPGPEQVVWITKAALYWTRFVRLDRYREAFERMIADHPTELVAPAHGAVIDNIDTVWSIWDALNLSYSPLEGIATAAGTPADA
jgi:flavorubredoxin